MGSAHSTLRRWPLWLLLILLVAAVLRFAFLNEIPPGLTHDEADHGITALSILEEGTREIYFTIGYGREPLYDYASAVTMALFGVSPFTGRATAVGFSLLMIAAMALWTRRAYDDRIALMTAAGLAVGFWPLMTARQMLRSITLPALFVLALYFFWRGAEKAADDSAETSLSAKLIPFLLSGLLLGLTFYTYIPARALWVIFPLLLAYWLVVARPSAKRLWPWVLLQLTTMALVAAPLLHTVYLTHPEAEQRIGDLSAPLTAALNGDVGPLLANVVGGLKLIVLTGDTAWRYNLPGRPFLMPLMALLFVAGLGVALWQVGKGRNSAEIRQPSASFLALSWLAVGMLPVLITGPELSTTQAIGVQPVVFLFPALALSALLSLPMGGKKWGESGWGVALVVGLFAISAVVTVRDYFVRWANAPEVRVQYESTQIAALDYINEQSLPAVISSITPDRYHSPAVAELVSDDPDALRWFDARGALLLPDEPQSLLLIPGFTPLDPLLADWLSAEIDTRLPLRPTDLDRPIEVYQLTDETRTELQSHFSAEIHPFGDAITLHGVALATPQAAPGEDVVVATLWQVHAPLPDATLFTHVQGTDGVPIAQADLLSAPGAMWRAGDWFVQVHRITLPPDSAEGNYPIAVGIYTPTGRLTLPDGSDLAPVATLEIVQP